MVEAYERLKTCTPLQRRYIELRIQGLSPTPAARGAGASEGSYKQLENHPKVKAIIGEINKQALNKLVVTREDVIAGFLDAVNSAATSTELTAAWRELGKMIGAYEPEVLRIEERPTAEKIRKMKDSDLAALAEQEGFELPQPMNSDDCIEAEFEEIKEEGKDAGHGCPP